MKIVYLLLAFTPATDVPEVLGLLQVDAFTEVLSCEEYVPPEQPVFGDASLTRQIGLLIGKPTGWGSGARGEARCGTRYVSFYEAPEGRGERVPRDMHGYEEFGFLVTDQQDNAYEIELGRERGWVAKAGSRFHSVEELLKSAAFFVPARTVRFCMAPGHDCQLIEAPTGYFDSMSVHEWRKVGPESWLNATINEVSDCFDTEMNAIKEKGLPAKVRGWLPLRDEEGRLNFWYAAKGC